MLHLAPLVMLLWTTPQASAKGGEGWVVIVRGDESIPDAWTQELRKAAEDAAKSSKKVRYVPPPEISTKEVELALGCQGWNATCAGQVATMLSANATLTVDIVQRGRGAWLSTELVGSDGKLRGSRERHELPDRADLGLRAARAFVASRVTGTPVTGLVVDTDTPGAAVSLDGANVGQTPVALYDVAPGLHRIEITQEGKAKAEREVDVPKGTIHKVAIVMVAPSTTESQRTPSGESAPVVDEPELVPPLLGYGVLAAGGGLLVMALASGAANVGVLVSHQYYEGFDTQKSYYSRRIFGTDESASAVSFATGIGFYVIGAVGLVVGTVGAVLVGVSFMEDGSAPTEAATVPTTPTE